jgi:hypothetical protein
MVCSTDNWLKENHRHIREDQQDKSPEAENSISSVHRIQVCNISILSTIPRYRGERGNCKHLTSNFYTNVIQ